jgi:hypothetical protein
LGWLDEAGLEPGLYLGQGHSDIGCRHSTAEPWDGSVDIVDSVVSAVDGSVDIVVDGCVNIVDSVVDGCVDIVDSAVDGSVDIVDSLKLRFRPLTSLV